MALNRLYVDLSLICSGPGCMVAFSMYPNTVYIPPDVIRIVYIAN